MTIFPNPCARKCPAHLCGSRLNEHALLFADIGQVALVDQLALQLDQLNNALLLDLFRNLIWKRLSGRSICAENRQK